MLYLLYFIKKEAKIHYVERSCLLLYYYTLQKFSHPIIVFRQIFQISTEFKF